MLKNILKILLGLSVVFIAVLVFVNFDLAYAGYCSVCGGPYYGCSTGSCTTGSGYDSKLTTCTSIGCGCCDYNGYPDSGWCGLYSCWGCPPPGSSCDNGPTCTWGDPSYSYSTTYYCPGTSCSTACSPNSAAGCLSSCSSNIGLKMYDGTTVISVAIDANLSSPLRIAENGTIYGITLVDTTSTYASKFRISTASGIKAIKKL